MSIKWPENKIYCNKPNWKIHVEYIKGWNAAIEATKELNKVINECHIDQSHFDAVWKTATKKINKASRELGTGNGPNGDGRCQICDEKLPETWSFSICPTNSCKSRELEPLKDKEVMSFYRDWVRANPDYSMARFCIDLCCRFGSTVNGGLKKLDNELVKDALIKGRAKYYSMYPYDRRANKFLIEIQSDFICATFGQPPAKKISNKINCTYCNDTKWRGIGSRPSQIPCDMCQPAKKNLSVEEIHAVIKKWLDDYNITLNIGKFGTAGLGNKLAAAIHDLIEGKEK